MMKKRFNHKYFICTFAIYSPSMKFDTFNFKLFLIFFFAFPAIMNAQDAKILQKNLPLIKSKNDSIKLVALKKICWEYRDSDPKKGMDYGMQALEIAFKHKWNYHIAEIYNFIGIINRNLGNYDKALDFYFNSLQIYDDTVVNFPHAASLNNIGNLYYRMGFFKEALHFTTLAEQIFDKLNSQLGIAYVYNQYGIIYQKMDSTDKALNYHKNALRIRKSIAHKNGIATSYLHLSEIYLSKGKANKALSYLDSSIFIYKKIKSYNGIASCYLVYGEYFSLKKQITRAIHYYENALKIAKTISAVDIQLKALEKLKVIAISRNEADKALIYYQEYTKINDSLLNLRFGFQLAQLAKELELQNNIKINKLEADRKLSISRNKIKSQNEKIVIISCFAVILLILIITLLYYSQRLKKSLKILGNQNTEIQDKNEELKQLTEETRSQAEQLEKANEELEKLSIVARETNNAVIIADDKLELIWANESFSRFYGLSLEEFKRNKGNTLYDVSGNKDIKNFIDMAVASKKSISYSNEYKYRNGRTFWTQTSLTPIIDANNKLEKIIAIDSDITELKQAKDKIEFQNKEITSSISYAGQLQNALLPMKIFMDALIDEYFILYYPKDIVSGDFYWLTRKYNKNIIAIADCTGHGIPGAFMTALSITLLRNTIDKTRSNTPDILLNELRFNLIKTLHQRNKQGSMKDGFDISLIYFNPDNYLLEYAGANLPIVIVRNKKATLLKPDKMPIGVYEKDNQNFTLKSFQLQAGDMVYMFTDGFADQFGGEKNKKYMRKKLVNKLETISDFDLKLQKGNLAKEFMAWKGENEQVDDVLVYGFRV